MLQKEKPRSIFRFYSYLVKTAYLFVFIIISHTQPVTVLAVCADYSAYVPTNATDVWGIFNVCPQCSAGAKLLYSGDTEVYIETLDTITCYHVIGPPNTIKLNGTLHDVKTKSFNPLPAGAIVTGGFTIRQKIYTSIAAFDGCDNGPSLTYHDLYATSNNMYYTFLSQIPQCCSDAGGEGFDDGTGLNCTPAPNPAPGNDEGAPDAGSEGCAKGAN